MCNEIFNEVVAKHSKAHHFAQFFDQLSSEYKFTTKKYDIGTEQHVL